VSGPDLGIERGAIITISTSHLHPATRELLDEIKGDLPEGPSVAVRDEGFLVNSHLGSSDVLEQDFTEGQFPTLYERMPDLVMIRALARGLGAEWINIDQDGVEYADILPVYDDYGQVNLPGRDGWKDAFSTMGETYEGATMVMPTRAVLEVLEAGQTPGLPDDTPGLG
jgi:hypothetical protein